jgi:hypothetical protein
MRFLFEESRSEGLGTWVLSGEMSVDRVRRRVLSGGMDAEGFGSWVLGGVGHWMQVETQGGMGQAWVDEQGTSCAW